MSLEWLELDMRAIVEALSDDAVLSLALWGEARSEPIEGIVAVGCVIRNRAADKRWPDTIRGVCLQRKQFSCWRPEGGPKNYARMLEIGGRLAKKELPPLATFEQCAWVALGISKKALQDNTNGSYHYHTANLTPRPSWAQNVVPIKQIAHHVFYNNVK
jgi:N-acetylmuramoyl-L-alanine amidase